MTTTKKAPRVLAVEAVRTLSTATAIAWVALFKAAFAGWEPTPADVGAVWKEGGAELKESAWGVYSSKLAQAFKLAKAKKPLPDLTGLTSARQVQDAVDSAYKAAGLKSAKGAPVGADAAAREAAKAAAEASKAAMLTAKAAAAKAESAQFVAAVQGAKAADKAKAAKATAEADAAIAAALAKAEAAKVAKAAADTAKADAMKAKAEKAGPTSTAPKAATQAERTNARKIAQDVAHQLAALATRCAADPILRGAIAGALANVETMTRNMVGAIDEATSAASVGKGE